MPETILEPVSSCTISSVSIIDSDLIPTLNQTATTNLYYLTTAQCKDAEYLSGIGFPVISIS